jgi:hypothetical protein
MKFNMTLSYKLIFSLIGVAIIIGVLVSQGFLELDTFTSVLKVLTDLVSGGGD